MEKKFKRLCAALLTASILLTLASCGEDKASEDNTTTTESTTITATTAPEKTTEASTTTSVLSTTEVEETEATQKTTKADKAEATQAKPTQVKPTEAKTKPTLAKTTEAKTTEAKTTEAKPQKATPKFVFSQSFPVKVTAFSAEYEIIKAYTSNGYWYNEDTYLFDINITVKRCDDGINEEKASAVQMKIKDSNGNVVRNTSTSAGMLSIGEQGTGCMAWSVDAPGTYTIEFSSI